MDIHLQNPMASDKGHKINEGSYIFNKAEIVEENSQLVETGMQGAHTRILLQKVKLFYRNFSPKEASFPTGTK